jgi:predicted GH43/DUF377 family glycosyl hydrolase
LCLLLDHGNQAIPHYLEFNFANATHFNSRSLCLRVSTSPPPASSIALKVPVTNVEVLSSTMIAGPATVAPGLISERRTVLGAHIWISYSPDLRHWGSHKVMLEARRGAWWDANKIGLASPPIETSRGWLVLYHGVRQTPSGCLYRLGLALFDLQQPDKCLLRGDSWIFRAEAEYERRGDVHDVVFPCGYTMGLDGDTLNIYYGAADSCIGLAHASVRSLLAWLDVNGRYERRRRAQDL